MMMPRRSVLVVGAGPSGLLAAGIIAGAGLDVTVLDKEREVSPQLRACTVHAGLMEVLDRERVPDLLDFDFCELGHYLGLPIRLSDCDSPWAGVWRCPQPQLIHRLVGWARLRGVRIQRRQRVVGIVQDDHQVHLRTAAGQSFAGEVLLAADGARSDVRRLLGIGITGPAATRTMIRADIENVTLAPRKFQRIGRRTVTCAAITEQKTRIMVHDPDWPVGPRIGQASLRAAWLAATGERLPPKLAWWDTFRDTTTRAERLLLGRVILCGEAAGQFIPIGGAALNGAMLGASAWARAIADSADPFPVDELQRIAEEQRASLVRRTERLRAEARLLFDPDPQARAERERIALRLRLNADFRRHVQHTISWLNSPADTQRSIAS
ncbi:MAG: FAD-dependent oxidoreductase [Angustibacter sp.]